MKTSYTSEDVRQFLQTTEHANPDSIEQLAEGHISQALGFETNDGSKLVLRIASHQNDFLADQYAGNVFGQALLVPKVTEIGNFCENLTERTALYHAVNALLTIDFADRHKNESVIQWLHENVAEKVIPK